MTGQAGDENYSLSVDEYLFTGSDLYAYFDFKSSDAEGKLLSLALEYDGADYTALIAGSATDPADIFRYTGASAKGLLRLRPFFRPFPPSVSSFRAALPPLRGFAASFSAVASSSFRSSSECR